MKYLLLCVTVFYKTLLFAQPAHTIKEAVQALANTLSETQKKKAFFAFTDEERVHWNFVPTARKGIPLKELDAHQQKAFMNMLHVALSDEGYRKASSIMQLEVVLKSLENRGTEDGYRDPGKYYFSLFGMPSDNEAWGWRVEGHHVAFNFTHKQQEVAATPYFMGSNPAIVPSGPDKGKQILKPEAEKAFSLLHALKDAQLNTAIIAAQALPEIITGNDRIVKPITPQGIAYSKLNDAQQKLFRDLIAVYIMNYSDGIANSFMKSIEADGYNQFYFAWAGAKAWGEGHYYRIQGKTLWIEYDNTQTNANHVHTVVRSIDNDFGDDLLKKHYEEDHRKP